MKSFPKDKQYYFYAAISFIQQVPTAELKPNNLNITMASRTLEKIENEFGFTNPEGFYSFNRFLRIKTLISFI